MSLIPQRTPNGLLPHEDKIWRLNNLYKIRSKTGVLPFKLNRLQIKVLEDCRGMNPIRHITLKSRQVGLSTLWILYWLDDTLFRRGVISGIMAHKLDSLQHLSSIVKFALDNLNFTVKYSEDNKTRISFAHNDSTILIDLEFRSTPLHNLHISEWAFCDDVRIWATLGAISKWANVTGESTGNGMGNDFYTSYLDALDKKSEYRSRFIPWFAHEEYQMPLPKGMAPFLPDKRERDFKLTQEQIHYRRQKMTQLKSSFFVEYPETEEDAFASSGLMYFNNKKIIALSRDARELDKTKPPIERTDNYTIWESPEREHRYAIGADVAEGVDGDRSCFKVLCVDCRQEAMAYRGNVGLDTFYYYLDTWGRKYNRALLAVERNNHGHAVIQGLNENLRYPNLFKETRDQPIVINLSKARPETKYGWHTTAITKPLMLDHLKLAIEGDSEEDENTFQPDYIVRDLDFLSECLTFCRNGSKLEASSGKHDDTIIASAIAYQMYLRLKSKMSSGLEKVMFGVKRESI